MKDRNGTTLRTGDVCVVHVIPNVVAALNEAWHGEICVISGFRDWGSYQIIADVDADGYDELEFCADELEIIGDVGERAK